MFSPSNVINFAVIFGSVQLIIASEATWKTHDLITETGWSKKVEWFDNPILVYAQCNEERRFNSKRECVIVQYKDVHNDGIEPRRCMFALEKASHGIIRIQSLGNDSAIFVWSDDVQKKGILHYTFNTAVIDMSSCEIVDTGLVLTGDTWQYGPGGWHMFFVGILAYDNAFDVFLQKVRECDEAVNDQHCVYTYDDEGKLMAGPVTVYSPSSPGEYYQLRRLSYHSADKGYLVHAGQNVFLAKPHGHSAITTKILWQLPEEKGLSRNAYSCSNEIVTFCICRLPIFEVNCRCLQTDQEGNSKRQMDIVLTNPRDIVEPPMVFTIYNLRSGGFVFIPFYTAENEHFYSMSIVKADSRVVGEPTIIGSHSRDCSPEYVNTRFVEQDDGQHCITLACIEKHNAVLKTYTKCYPSSFFK